ncbi:hypothetical protein, partial [Pectobacterium versatile]|uniref:hypothetical protein n=1 Tax=Pectobacterium versatile TaxID=2488639 RepID=UPI001B39425B
MAGLTRGVLPLALRAALGGPKRQSCRFVEPCQGFSSVPTIQKKTPLTCVKGVFFYMAVRKGFEPLIRF